MDEEKENKNSKFEYENAIYIFRRDLRIYDNKSLNNCYKFSKNIFPLFIFNENQATKKNPFYNQNSIQFLIESLENLEQKIPISILYGNQLEILEKIVKQNKIQAIFQNYDYTPFARIRDKKIKEFCEKLNIDFIQYHDYLLNPPKSVLKPDKTPYGVFTPFYKKSIQNEIKQIEIIKFDNSRFKTIETSTGKNLENNNKIYEQILSKKTYNKNILVHGGTNNAHKILDEITSIKDYENMRDYPSIKGTSLLSPHLKFGTVSIRETYFELKEKLGNSHPLIRQLYWRDFWTYVAYHNSKVFKTTYISKYEKIKWNNNKELFQKWCEGKTGFPIVDAGMRELNQTGFMHNRVRMVVASFLTKDLHIDYKWGEKYLAQKLTDYDPSLNNGNWQWAASTGCDGQPYFRIFNPWSQQIKFDENCDYIKKWIPELKGYENKQIHKIFKENLNDNKYPNPIVEHDIESKLAKEIFKNC